MVRSAHWQCIRLSIAQPRSRNLSARNGDAVRPGSPARLLSFFLFTVLLAVPNLACDRAGSEILNLPGQGPADFATIENQSLSITFSDLPEGANNASRTVNPVPQHGSLQMPDSARDGALAVTYIPDPGFVGTDSFSIELRDSENALHTITAGVIVYPEVRFEVDILSESPMLLVEGRAFCPSGHALPEGTYQWGFDGVVESGTGSTHMIRQHAFSSSGTHIVTLTLALTSFGNYQCSKGPTGEQKQAEVASANSRPTDPGTLSVNPSGAFAASGTQGGPFSPSSMAYTLTNPGDQPIVWTASKTQSWVTLSSSGATLAPRGTGTLTVFINATANALLSGTYNDTVTITNTTNGFGTTTRNVTLTVNPFGALAVTPGTNFTTNGSVGGPFSPSSTGYVLSNTGSTAINWTASATGNWVTLSSAGGTLNAFASTTLTVTIDADANALAEGNYSSTVTISTNSTGSTTRTINLSATAGPLMASSVSQYGITWTFDKPYRVGQFVNGDWWVCPDIPIASVNVVSVSPQPIYEQASGDQLARNGSQKNPIANSGMQGYDSRNYSSSGSNYDAQLAVHFPATLQAGDSLVSSLSRPDNDPNRNSLTGQSIALSKTKLITAAVLTCLSSVPPSDAFRPPYAGTTKPIYRTYNLRRDLLPSLTPPNLGDVHQFGRFAFTIPSGVTVGQHYARYWQRPWIMHVTGDRGENVRPLDNCPGYYSWCHSIESDAALLLLCDPGSSLFGGAQGSHEDLLINFIQYGIDTYYTIQSNPNPASRGDRCLSKWPCIFAGLLLDDSSFWQNIPYNNPLHNYAYFKTDACTYHGTPWTNSTHRPSPYNNALFRVDPTSGLDDPQLFNYEYLDPFTTGWCGYYPGSNPYWREEAYRRSTHSFTWIGTALAARIMNATSKWNHDPFFDYVDRWMNEDETWFSALDTLGNSNPCGNGIYDMLYSQGPPSFLMFRTGMWSTYR